MKRIPFHKMKLQDGCSFKVINAGVHNEHNDGPDFFDAKIEIDGLIWVGSVELHVKSSDWNLHKHQFDKAYDNVILHVVYDDNATIYQHGRLIPCLALKQIIDPIHLANYVKMKVGAKQQFMCAHELNTLDPIYIYSAIDRAVVSRIERKLSEIKDVSINDAHEVVYRLIAQAFGSKVNKLPFEELTKRLPFAILKQLNNKNRTIAIEHTSGLFQSTSISELLNEERKLREIALLNIGSVNHKSWKFSGVRPQGFPTMRIQQFIKFLEYFDIETISFDCKSQELLRIINSAIENVNKNSESHLKISKSLGESIIINAFVPFVVWLAKKYDRSDISENAIELLSLLSAETNSILTKWKSNGVNAKNAQESQGLIELYNEHCLKKKCLSCAVGTKLLNR